MGRQLQALVSSTVMRVLQLGVATGTARAEAKIAKAKSAREKRARACQLLAKLADRHKKVGFEALALPVRHRQREPVAMSREDRKARQVAEFRVQEEKRKADLEYTEHLKCPEFRAQVEREQIQRQKENQAANVAYHANKRRKVQQ